MVDPVWGSEIVFLNYKLDGCLSAISKLTHVMQNTYFELALKLTIRFSIPQWLKDLTDH